MIEIRFNTVDMKRIKHDVSHWVAILNAARAAGMPLVGTIGFRAVSRGTLTVTVEEDLDGDISIWRWFDDDERQSYLYHIAVPPSSKAAPKYRRLAHGRGEGYTWAKYEAEGLDDDI